MKRRLIQLCAALLYNLNLKGFAEASIYKGKSKGLCVPGLNCYSCPGAVGSCPLGTLQNALSAMDRKLPFYILGSTPALWGYHGKDHMRFPLSLWPGAGASL